ncbi:uncharacterized protein LOC112345116 [Selaginella moellendorffii]|uniref:uncharacterized protein LOC112345116 n=1 Tax=Selaginella moellendorffii TaxID=88036 RepID=UPI000D1D01A7|nr:uncharacterized protein LOC112345116 [Selaginella moellendorffii]|eukprot:XP_024526965.1 uncharacterized protein LOC112345116 [Selaginella moellendorffii]
MLPSSCDCTTNFAYAGATALGIEYFQERDVPVLVNVSFDNEIRWFRSKRERCDPRKSGRVAALVGGSGNDYNLKTSGIEAYQLLVSEGIRTVSVLNVPQPACTPDYRLRHPAEDLDEFGCVRAIGEVVKRHNSMLEAALLALYNKPHSSVRIFVLNRYKFLNDVLRDPMKYGSSKFKVVLKLSPSFSPYQCMEISVTGFDRDITHVACCGGGIQRECSVWGTDSLRKPSGARLLRLPSLHRPF